MSCVTHCHAVSRHASKAPQGMGYHSLAKLSQLSPLKAMRQGISFGEIHALSSYARTTESLFHVFPARTTVSEYATTTSMVRNPRDVKAVHPSRKCVPFPAGRLVQMLMKQLTRGSRGSATSFPEAPQHKVHIMERAGNASCKWSLSLP